MLNLSQHLQETLKRVQGDVALTIRELLLSLDRRARCH